MNSLVAFLNLATIAAVMYYWSTKATSRKLFVVAFLLKVLAGIALGVIYKFYYTVGDTFGYFEEGRLLANLARRDFLAYVNFLFQSAGEVPGVSVELPRALFFTKLTSVFNLITLDNYWIISIYFSLLSFGASWFLFRTFSKALPEVKLPTAIAFLFFPSIVFWSSGLVKECISTASLFFLTAVFTNFWFKQKIHWWQWALAFVSVWFLWTLKYYILAAFFLVAATALLYRALVKRFMQRAGALAEITVVVLLIFLPAIAIVFLHPNLYPDRLLEVIVDNNETFVELSAKGDVIVFSNLKPTFLSIVLNSPNALFSGLFRPLLWEASNILQLAMACENFVLLAVALFSLRYISNVVRSPHRILLYMLIIYVVAVCIFLALSAPNFGTLSRYRVAYLPYFVFLISSARPMLDLLNRAFGTLAR